MKKINVIPKAVVGADPEIQRMREKLLSVSVLDDSALFDFGADSETQRLKDMKKENKNMKKTNIIPKAIVGSDSEIQRMRELLTSGQDVIVGPDGTLRSSNKASHRWIGEDRKAKTVPPTIVSGIDQTDTNVSNLINQMRNNVESVDDSIFRDDEKENMDMKKTNIIPKAIVGADPEIQRVRDWVASGEGLIVGDDGTIRRSNETSHSWTGNDRKSKTVPPTIVSGSDQTTASVSDLINEMRSNENPDETINEKGSTGRSEKEKKTIIPKTVVGVRSVSEIIDEMRVNGADDSYDDLDNEEIENSGVKIDKPSVVPPGIVSSDQWYKRNPDLLLAEKAAMYDFMGNKAKFKILGDGRACWQVNIRPVIAGKDKKDCRSYDLALIYDNDHPKVRYGSSVRAYFLKPTVEDLLEIVNRSPNVNPKTIPHLFTDDNGERYMCSADKKNVSDDLTTGITSAATSLRYAMRWINIFELGLIDPTTWELFHDHGRI